MQEKSNRKVTRRGFAAGALLLSVPPALILYGVYGPDGSRKYLLISLLLLLCAMAPFFLSFERRKPQARELVTIAVLCAIAVAGRAAFYALPQFKPVAAVVILSGVCLGAQPGFLVGALSAFVSNFFFGQGPFTPWQMFAFGLIGFLAGALFHNGPLKTGRLALCIYGGASTFLLYGGIVNLGSLLLSGFQPTLPAYLAFCAAGVPFDLIHAAASVTFLFFLSRPMIRKLERMQTKYGIIEEGDTR